MRAARKAGESWKIAKIFLLAHLMAFITGGLAAEMRSGGISESDRLQAVILLITGGALLTIVTATAIWRHRAGTLSVMERKRMLISMVILLLCFVFGWYAKASLAP